METTKLPTSWCPKCAHRLDAATGIDKIPWIPKPGDFSMCVECSTILRFDAQMLPRLTTSEDLWLLEQRQPKEYALLRHAQALNAVRRAAERGRPQG